MNPHIKAELLLLLGLLVGGSAGAQYLVDEAPEPRRRLRADFVWSNNEGGGGGVNHLHFFGPKPTGRPTPQPSPRPTRKPNPATKKPSPKPTARPTGGIATRPLFPDPTARPTQRPSRRPTPRPSPRPTRKPNTKRPTRRPTTKRPTAKPTPRPVEIQPLQQATFRGRCFTNAIYDAIHLDVTTLADSISDAGERSHFLGGIVRLAAHDFMDFDRRNNKWPMGPDGCFNTNDPANDGLPEDVWCDDCNSGLKKLFDEKYKAHITRADFWVAAANAVIKHTSVDHALDLRETFRWGRRDRERCFMAKERLPRSSGCQQVEEVFLGRMGLTWTDAVALMGAHTLGRGHEQFSGHPGRWAKSDAAAQVFDKGYYEAMFEESWTPREHAEAGQDWTTVGGGDRLMLNTDLCLAFDVDDVARSQCCTGRNCEDRSNARRRCPMIDRSDSRFEAREAVAEMLGGANPNDNNGPFYGHFAHAWEKATTVGQRNLSRLVDRCEEV